MQSEDESDEEPDEDDLQSGISSLASGIFLVLIMVVNISKYAWLLLACV